MRTPRVARNVARKSVTRDSERGSGTAETVIVLGLLALIILGMVQYAADVHGQQAAQAAASLALATAREQNGTAAAGRSAAAAELAQLTTAIHNPVIDVERGATEVTVTITGSVTGLFGVTEHVRASAAGPVDQFEPNADAGS
jgi:Flp pilus assembly protein TadG